MQCSSSNFPREYIVFVVSAKPCSLMMPNCSCDTLVVSEILSGRKYIDLSYYDVSLIFLKTSLLFSGCAVAALGIFTIFLISPAGDWCLENLTELRHLGAPLPQAILFSCFSGFSLQSTVTPAKTVHTVPNTTVDTDFSSEDDAMEVNNNSISLLQNP